MKYLYIIIILFGLFLTSCEEETEEHKIIDNYFLKVENDHEFYKLTKYNYFDTIPKTEFYHDDFEEPNESTWQTFNDDYGIGIYKNGSFSVEAKIEHQYPNFSTKLDYDQKRDFQIQIKFSLLLDNSYSNYGGFIFNIGENNKGYYCYFIKNIESSSDNSYIFIINNKDEEDGFYYEYNKQLGSPNQLTIRKVNNEIAFFVDKKHIVYTEFKNNSQPSGIAYTISERSTIEIKNLEIDYLN